MPEPQPNADSSQPARMCFAPSHPSPRSQCSAHTVAGMRSPPRADTLQFGAIVTGLTGKYFYTFTSDVPRAHCKSAEFFYGIGFAGILRYFVHETRS